MAASEPKSRVDFVKMRAEYEKFRESVKTGPSHGQVTIRAVASIVQDVHLEGTVRGSRFESDEPEERGGTNLGPAPLSYFLMGAAFWLLTQIARFAHLYDVLIEEGKVDVRCSFDVADKLGLDGPGAAFDSVHFLVDLQSPAPPEQVKKLIEHARRGCHTEQTFRHPIPVSASAKLNGQELGL
jgi:uncharacterized OsmC-like protein